MSLRLTSVVASRYVTLQNAVTALVVIVMGFLLLVRPMWILIHTSRNAPGARAATTADSLTDILGERHPVLQADSATALVFLDATCVECRMFATTYVDLVAWARTQGVDVRIIMPNDVAAAAQFGRLAGLSGSSIFVSPEWYRALDITHTPSVLLLDLRGSIRGRWLGQAPTHLAMLNVLGRFEPFPSAAIKNGNIAEVIDGRRRHAGGVLARHP